MRARPRRETPSSKTRPRTDPLTSPPTPTRVPQRLGFVQTSGDRIAERFGRRPARHGTRAPALEPRVHASGTHSLSHPGHSPDPRPDGIDPDFSPIPATPAHHRIAGPGDPTPSFDPDGPAPTRS